MSIISLTRRSRWGNMDGMRYTTQDQLGRFGARWGCFATCLINITEHIMGRRMRQSEVDTCLGVWTRSENVILSNYLNHDDIHYQFSGWGPNDDPEWHFYVKDMHAAVADILTAFDAPDMSHKYTIKEFSTSSGSHFILYVNGKMESNPDKSVKYGALLSTRRVN